MCSRTEKTEKSSRLQKAINTAIVVADSEITTDKVSVGTTVTIEDMDEGETFTYAIVGAQEADPFEDKISNECPVGAALVGRAVGDRVEVEAPAAVLHYEILEIKR